MLQKVTIKTIKKITKANKQRNCFKTKISKQAITFEKKMFLYSNVKTIVFNIHTVICTHMYPLPKIL